MNFFPFFNPPVPLVSNASNFLGGTNPEYTVDDFFEFYPQFENVIDEEIVEQFVTMAQATVQERRWKESWFLGMALFLAHFSTLYLQTQAGDNPTAAQVVSAAYARGLITSKSVGSVSVSYDYSLIGDDLEGWAAWKLTVYGQQYAGMANLLGSMPVYVW